MNHIHGYPHSKEAEFYKLLLNYDESLERDLADCGAIWYESGTQNLMVGDYRMSDRIASMVVSKYYGFIKRLVDNDKIEWKNRDLLDECIDNFERYPINMKTIDKKIELRNNATDMLIMIIAIQENPIEFLLSIIK